MISAKMKYQKRYAIIHGKRMAYVEVGLGDPIVFLHGNPTSSYLWRNIIPYCENLGRCIAPDLIGMGDSEKLDNPGPQSYRFPEQLDYLDALLEQLDVINHATLVIHDWGSALGAVWACRHPEAIKRIIILEGLMPYQLGWEDMGDERVQALFRGFKSEEGERMILEENMWIEQNLPANIMRTLSEEEMENYRRPFKNPGEDRRPMLSLARDVPIGGEPSDVSTMLQEAWQWLDTAQFPKLLITQANEIFGPMREAVDKWPNFSVKATATGHHFLQEDSPDEIGQTIADWLLQN